MSVQILACKTRRTRQTISAFTSSRMTSSRAARNSAASALRDIAGGDTCTMSVMLRQAHLLSTYQSATLASTGAVSG